MTGPYSISIAEAVIGTTIVQQRSEGDDSFGAGGAATGNEARTDTYEGPGRHAPGTFDGDIGGRDARDA